MPDRTLYKYGRIAKLAEALDEASVAGDARDAIMQGGEAVTSSSTNKQKADRMRGAMQRMDALLGRETRNAVREACACCLGGKRGELCREIAKKHASLEDRIAAASEAKHVFGQGVERLPDGRLRVCFFPEGQERYDCVCLRGADEPVSITYCHCCGGHIKHHLQTALGRKLGMEAESSALSSGGKKPCVFLFELLD